MKNIKIVYLILGLGIGMTLSNILYGIFPEIEYVNLSDEDIISRAQELGYVSIKEKILFKEDEHITEDNEQTQEKTDEIEESYDSEEQIIGNFIQIRIIEGDTLKNIANKLLKLGLIEDEEEFILAVEEKEMDKKFAYGTFNISPNADYDQIINLLTR